MRYLENTHDLRLPAWGPYTKKYIGISHLPEIASGLRFDLSIFPAFYRRKVAVPNVRWETGYHPWEASTDLGYYSHRHQLEGQDQVYCDISFSSYSATARLIRCEMVNRTPHPQTLALHYMASLHFPTTGPSSNELLQPARVSLPSGARWFDALEYTELSFASPRPTDNLVYDGFWRGEQRGHGFVNGSGLSQNFGQDPGDRVSYALELTAPIEEGCLLVRYRARPGSQVSFRLDGLANGELVLPGTGSFETATVLTGTLNTGQQSLSLTSLGGGPVELDGFVLVGRPQVAAVSFETDIPQLRPLILDGPVPESRLLHYEATDTFYGLRWGYEVYQVREFLSSELDSLMNFTAHNHVDNVISGDGQGHFTNIFLRPFFLNPATSLVVYGLVCAGSQEQVNSELERFNPARDVCEQQYHSARATRPSLETTPAGEKYGFSQQLMAATILTNVVYPVYMKRSYIRHHTPGRWWDSLYTWDSGFIGLGLAELDIERAVDCLNAYVTEPGDQHTAFIHHGSPLPVQHYLLLELFNRTQSREMLAFFYPRLRQYYRFLSGVIGTSTTRRFKSDLLQTWDYFYNSGGWDDYPAQVYVHREHLEAFVTPVCTTAHVIRAARLLRLAALELGIEADVTLYEADIASFSRALQQHAWDEDSGYFSYVRHDSAGAPVAHLRHPSGQNFNRGMDGASPLIAGICSPAQETRLLSHLLNPQELWTSIGLSAVDRSAAYYRQDGYWNGAIWFSHQWFFWKTLLDLGQPAAARQIALTALDLWKSEVEVSYNCFEHFMIQSGRGAGWHQFGGLSTPVLCWFGAYFRPGRLTCGFNSLITDQHFMENNSYLEATLKCYGPSGRPFSLLVTLNPDYKYSVSWNGQAAVFTEASNGVLEITLEYAIAAVGLLQIIRL